MVLMVTEDGYQRLKGLKKNRTDHRVWKKPAIG